MKFNDKMIDKLRLSVKNKLSDKRYIHTLGVEEMAVRIGDIFLPQKTDELRISALLHDITKELSYEQQLNLLQEGNVEYNKEDLDTKAALHSISAIPEVIKEYSEYVTPDVLSAISNHTLGKDKMSVFDEIIFISDYVESGRTYPSCIKTRDYLLNNLSAKNTYEQNLNFLHKSVLMAINFTIDSLNKRGEITHSKTYLAKAYFESVIEN